MKLPVDRAGCRFLLGALSRYQPSLSTWRRALARRSFCLGMPTGYDLRQLRGEDAMALLDDILSGGNWVTGLAIGVGAVIVLPLAAPILRPLAKTAIKGAFWPTRARRN
jgi:hypothetical protein